MFKVKLKQFKIRIKVAWCVLTGKWPHFLVLRVDAANLENLCSDEEFHVDMAFHKLHQYCCEKMIVELAKTYSADYMILSKGDYEATAVEWLQNHKKK